MAGMSFESAARGLGVYKYSRPTCWLESHTMMMDFWIFYLLRETAAALAVVLVVVLCTR